MGKKEAKKQALMDMKKKYKESRMPDMKGMKKVTVASDSEEGLEEGLSMAEKILKKRESMEDVVEDEPLLGKEYAKKKKSK